MEYKTICEQCVNYKEKFTHYECWNCKRIFNFKNDKDNFQKANELETWLKE